MAYAFMLEISQTWSSNITRDCFPYFFIRYTFDYHTAVHLVYYYGNSKYTYTSSHNLECN